MSCPVHGCDAPCRCGYARTLLGLLFCVSFVACAALQSVTPADREAAYAADAKATQLKCKAYRFDRAAGLVADVPAMAELCK